MAPPPLSELLARSSALHGHLCPRQILGVRLALLAGERLGLDFPRTDKRALVFVETDGCFADGVSVDSGCWLGRRTMRLIDHGKVAATFVDTRTRRAVRAAPQTDLRRGQTGRSVIRRTSTLTRPGPTRRCLTPSPSRWTSIWPP